MLKSVELLISLGYSKKDAEDITNSYPLVTLKDETLCKKINENFNYLIDLGYTKPDVIKMTKILPSLYSYSKEKIEEKISFLISLGYTMIDIIKMTKILPSLYGYSKETIEEKISFLISLGYTMIDIIKMTNQFPALYSLSKENIKDKIKYLRDIGLEDIVINDTRQLIQSVFLTYARYEFLTKEKGIIIDESNYRKLFCGETNFKKQYGVSKNMLLKKYSYEKYKGSIKL